MSGGIPKVTLILTQIKEMGVILVEQIFYTELNSNDSSGVFRYLIIFVDVKHN